MMPELAAAFGVAKAAGSVGTDVLSGGTTEGKLLPGDIMALVGANRMQRIPPRLRGLSSRRPRNDISRQVLAQWNGANRHDRPRGD
jgi:hypothetical protein